MTSMDKIKLRTLYFTTVATSIMLASVSISQAQSEQDDICDLEYVELPSECEDENATTAVNVTANPNTEWDRGAVQNNAGFVLAIDGDPLNSDRRVEDRIRDVDLALEAADIRVTFDGLGVEPRLDLSIDGQDRLYQPGEAITFQSRLNYPAFVERGEIILIDRAARGGARVLSKHAISPNGQATIRVPEGTDVVAVHRVYSPRGQFDETAALPLSRRDDRGVIDGVEEGIDSTARRRIPVNGGAITVSGSSVRSGSVVNTLGETITPDRSGSFAIQRILPVGEYEVDVSVSGTGQAFSREVEIPKTDWFYVAIADVTYGQRSSNDPALDGSYTKGRLAFYSKSKHANGVTVTASADTGEEEIENLFDDFFEKDVNSVLRRMAAEDSYPVYGDDSEIRDDTPTSGKFYVKVEKDGNFALWGDYKGRLNGNHYIRNERELYGAQIVGSTQAQTANGEPRASVQLFAAEPDSLPAREVLRGTGGSLYFLQRQDIIPGSETISIEIRDAETDRVLDRKVLQNGLDYDLNAIQGTVMLSDPLTGSLQSGLIQSSSSGDQTVNLVVQYEYVPTLSDIDGYSYGGRIEAWATDQLRFGVTATSDSTGTADQTTLAADVLYQISDNSFFRLDYAETDGPGFGNSFSTDGGLIVNNTAAVAGSGEAWKAEAKLAFEDIGIGQEGYVGAYAERRTEGFSTLDYQVTATTGDEDLWGVYVEGSLNGAVQYALSYDSYENAVGTYKRELGAEVSFPVNQDLGVTIAAEHLDRNTGDRLDLAARVDWTANSRLDLYAFGQATLNADGLDDNNRFGVGFAYQATDQWSAEGEISDGTDGFGARALARYEDGENRSLYFGYELDPGRNIGSAERFGKDLGQYIVGGERAINDRLSVYTENRYDLFGRHNSLVSAFGATYSPSSFMTYDAALEIGRVQDDVDGDFDRTALSFGTRYQDEQLSATGRIEYRTEDGVLGGSDRDANTILVAGSARYKYDEASRLLVDFKAADTQTDQSSILDGRLIDASIGYAYRPVDNDRLNLLFKYRYLHDDYGQRVDGDDTNPRQRSHILSLDASYDLNEHWTLGGKIGGRWTESSPDAETPFTSNDAWLGVVNLRYRLIHKWDGLIEGRVLNSENGGTDTGVVGAVYRHFGNNIKVGAGYNFGSFSDDLSDLTLDDNGPFINVIAKF